MAGRVAAAISPPAIVIQADRFEVARCRCPACLRLDKRFPHGGFQLALFPYRLQAAPRVARTKRAE